MRKRVFAIATIVVLSMPIGGQSTPSIQGVWKNVERTIPRTTVPGERVDPFGAYPVGTHAARQPGLLIFTRGYFSRTTDLGMAPRPTTAYAIPDKPTQEELQARWGPFAASAGTYELSGRTLTLRALVAKEPRTQRDGNFARLTVVIDGDALSLTPFANDAGRIVAGVTSTYVRVE